MTEAALAELGRGPTVTLMTRRRASAPPPQPPPQSADPVGSSASQTKRRSKSSGAAANSENVSEGGNESPAQGGAAKAGNTNPTLHKDHPEDACRYPNKRCYNKRAVKNNGELHKFCDMHRDSANRYQRKLEQRLKEKRIQSRMRAMQAQQAQAQAHAHAHTQMALMGAPNPMLVSPYPGMEVYGGVAPLAPTSVSGTMVPFPGHPTAAAAPIPEGTTPRGMWAQGEDEYEPFQHPVELQSEDLDCLYLLFHEP